MPSQPETDPGLSQDELQHWGRQAALRLPDDPAGFWTDLLTFAQRKLGYVSLLVPEEAVLANNYAFSLLRDIGVECANTRGDGVVVGGKRLSWNGATATWQRGPAANDRITPDDVAVYVENGGRACLCCQSSDITTDGMVNVDGDIATQQVACNACKFAWADNFYLASIDLLDEAGGFIEMVEPAAEPVNVTQDTHPVNTEALTTVLAEMNELCFEQRTNARITAKLDRWTKMLRG